MPLGLGYLKNPNIDRINTINNINRYAFIKSLGRGIMWKCWSIVLSPSLAVAARMPIV
jgi:hypothetical protein